MKKRLFYLLLCLIIVTVAIGGVVAQGYKNSFVPTIEAGPKDGQVISLLEGNIYTAIKNYTIESTQQYGSQKLNQYAPKTIEISWDCIREPEYYTLKLADNKKLALAQEFVTFDTSVELDCLYSGYHYYYQVVAHYEDNTVKSKTFDFETEALPRTIYIDGVSNTRDLGGNITESGKRVKQGMIYRTARLDAITADGLTAAFAKYNIKTDLDLRKPGEDSAGGTSPLGSDVNYINASCPYYMGSTTTGINNPNNWPAIKTLLQTFADPDNYPIVVHCSLGRDRTGNVCMIVNGLLGVSKEDIFRDYELSFFSKKGTEDFPNTTVNHLVTQLGKAYNYICTFGAEGDSFSTCVENFLIEVGLTKTEIESIRTIMLEEVK